MRTFGIVLIVLGSLNLLIGIIGAATLADVKGPATSINGGLMLLVIGGLLIHFANKKKEKEEEKKKWDN